MSATSPRLALPYIQPAQAQKHVTHNEAVQHLDALVQLGVLALEAQDPPVVPEAGDSYVLGQFPTSAWAGYAGNLAVWDGATWLFYAIPTGALAWERPTDTLHVLTDAGWAALSGLGGVDRFGINATAGTTNRLSVAAPATLLSHEGGGHQLKINKASDVDTASLLFQSNWTGHAEMGLAGDTVFSLKLSADGGTWSDVMRADPAGLQIDVPVTGTAVQASADDTTPGALMRADYGYGPGNVVGTVSATGGLPTGAVIEQGSSATGDYVRFADGTQICSHSITTVTTGDTAWVYPVPFATSPGSISAIANTGTPRFATLNSFDATAARFSGFDTAGAQQADVYLVTALGRWM